MTPPRRAAFLDRDGVLNERPPEHEYVTSRAGFRWLPGAAEAVARLAHAGWIPIVVSNQRGVARRLVSWDLLHELGTAVADGVAAHGARIAAFYYCPHDLDERCGCRKPAPGLLFRAADEHGIDLAESVMIGDSESDVEAGRTAGCRTIRVAAAGTPSAADAVVATLAEAADVILDGERTPRRRRAQRGGPSGSPPRR